MKLHIDSNRKSQYAAPEPIKTSLRCVEESPIKLIYHDTVLSIQYAY